jgi:hypothetical protein
MRDLAARAALVIGGLGALFSSFQTWAVFTVLFSFVPVTGAVLGYGLITALFAIPVIASGLVPPGSPMARRMIAVGSLCASGIVVGVAVAAIVIQVGVALPVFYQSLPEVHRYGLGLVATAISGGVAMAGARRRLIAARDES